MCSVIADSKCRPDAFAITAAGNDAVDRGTITGLAGQCTSGDKEFRRRTGDGRMESHPAVCGSSAVNGVYAASLYFGCDNVARIVMAEFHQIQEEREQQQREFDRKRNLMLSDIAHDLRTPVTTVSGYAKALADHMVQEPEKQQEYLNAIQNKSVRIGNLINLLFEYVKLDSEGFALNGKTLDLCELLRENAAMLYAEMEENGMTLTADIPEETIPVWADELQLSRVVTNLLTNAMQHNPKGTRIGLFAYRELERIYVLVADSGILIPEEQAQHLFDPFTRGDKARVSDGRNGLGLSIVSKIVQMHGWDLKLVQQPQIQHYAKAAGFAKAFVIRMENAGMYSVHPLK